MPARFAFDPLATNEMSDRLGHEILRNACERLAVWSRPVNLALDQAKWKSAALRPLYRRLERRGHAPNRHNPAVQQLLFSSCSAQNFSLILMQCSIILVMLGMNSPGRNRLSQ
jgi:hypothetical protein